LSLSRPDGNTRGSRSSRTGGHGDSPACRHATINCFISCWCQFSVFTVVVRCAYSFERPSLVDADDVFCFGFVLRPRSIHTRSGRHHGIVRSTYRASVDETYWPDLKFVIARHIDAGGGLPGPQSGFYPDRILRARERVSFLQMLVLYLYTEFFLICFSFGARPTLCCCCF